MSETDRKTEEEQALYKGLQNDLLSTIVRYGNAFEAIGIKRLDSYGYAVELTLQLLSLQRLRADVASGMSKYPDEGQYVTARHQDVIMHGLLLGMACVNRLAQMRGEKPVILTPMRSAVEALRKIAEDHQLSEPEPEWIEMVRRVAEMPEEQREAMMGQTAGSA